MRHSFRAGLIQQHIIVYKGTGSFCLSPLPFIVLDFYKTHCLLNSKMLQFQAFMGTSHILEEEMFLLKALKESDFFLRNPRQTPLVSHWA